MALRRLVGGMILHQDTVLLGRRSATRDFDPDVWDVFGGHIEPGEAPDEALLRELREELGITATGFALVTVMEEIHARSGDEIEFHLYTVTAWAGAPENVQPEEHSTIQWFTLREAQSLELALPAYVAIFQSLEDNGPFV